MINTLKKIKLIKPTNKNTNQENKKIMIPIVMNYNKRRKNINYQRIMIKVRRMLNSKMNINKIMNKLKILRQWKTNKQKKFKKVGRMMKYNQRMNQQKTNKKIKIIKTKTYLSITNKLH